MLGMHVEAARHCEITADGKVLAKLATCFEENLLALTHVLFTQPVRSTQLGAFSHCQRLVYRQSARGQKGEIG